MWTSPYGWRTASVAMMLALSMGAEDAIAEIEGIVVTAQKREQNVQDVPVAVTAIGGDALLDAGVFGINDLVNVVPNVAFGDSVTSRNRAIFIRGFGTQSLSDGVETSVGTFVDGVVMGRDFQGFNEFGDIERVEVLRGPQGTLFGKNTSAGLIHVVTKDPTFDFEADAYTSYGSDNEVKLKGSVSGPLADKAAVRLSGYFSDRDGVTNNAILNEEIDDDGGWGLRGKALFQPRDDLDILLAADYQETDEQCCDFVFRSAPAPNPALPPALQALTAFAAISAGGANPAIASPSNRTSVANSRTGEKTENYGASLTLTYHNWDHRFISITAYREGDIFEFNAADNSPLTVIDEANTDSSTEQFTQELRIESDGDGPVQYVGGFYYFTQEVDSVQQFLNADLTTFGFAPPTPLQRETTLHGASYDNIALFGQATWQFADLWRITGGLRYTHDEVDGFINRIESTTPPFPAGGPFVAAREEDNLSGRAALEFDFSDDVLLYASYARGYKGPAVQVDPLFSAAPGTALPTVDPEIVDSYELGARSAWFDNRLILNLTGFWTEVSDLQAAAFDPTTLGFPLQNVGEARSVGLETEFAAQPLDGLVVSGFVTLQDAEIRSFPNAGCYPGQTVAEGCVGGVQDLSGGDLPKAPDLTYRIAGEYSHAFNELWDAAVRVSYTWRDDTQFSLNNDPLTIQRSYGLLDASIDIGHDDRWTLSFFGRNLTDEDYALTIGNSVYTAFFNPQNGENSKVQILGRERHFGVALRARF